jgi:hypothetical protein
VAEPTPPVNVHKDPMLLLILVDLAVVTLPELDKAIQTGSLNWSTVLHIAIQGIITVIRMRSSDVITGIKWFDKD